MWKLGLRPRYSFSGNICFKSSAFCLCSSVGTFRWLYRARWNNKGLARSAGLAGSINLGLKRPTQPCTAKNHYRKFETHIPRKGIESQFPHSCVCERLIYSHDWSALFAAGNYVDRSWEYINRSQTHECENWDRDRAIPRKGILKWDFPCSLLAGVRLPSVFHWGNLLPAVTLITDFLARRLIFPYYDI